MPKFPDPFALSWGPWPPVAVEASHARRTLRVRLDALRERKAFARRLLARAEKLVRLAGDVEAGLCRDLCALLDDADRVVDFERRAAGLAPYQRRQSEETPARVDRMAAAIELAPRLSPVEFFEREAETALEEKARKIDCISAAADAAKIDGSAREAREGVSSSAPDPDPGSPRCGWNNSPGGRHPLSELRSSGDQSGHNSPPGCARGDEPSEAAQ